jgi:DNA-binding IclR family transcriptional regulator
VWLSLSAAPVCRENGVQFGAVLVVQDIDTNKRERDRLLKLLHEMTLAVSEKPGYPITNLPGRRSN